jgi:hypothetical protein
LNGAIPPGGLRKLLKSAYLKAQSRQPGNGRTAADKQSLNELDKHFQPFNQRLANELGLDLAVWD